MKPLNLILSVIATFPLAVSAHCPKHQLQEVQKKAAEDKKDVMMVFSGSTWNNLSKKFDAEILKSDEFKKTADKNFVQIVFDYPRERAKTETGLLEMRQKFKIRQLPTAILADAYGRPYAYTGMRQGGAAEYLKHLDELLKIRVERDRLFAEASKASGLDRAKLLVKGLEALPDNALRDFYTPELADIAASDPKGETGYIAKIEKAEALRKEQRLYQVLFREKKYGEIINRSEVSAAKVKGEDAQRLTLYKIQALATQEKYDEAHKCIDVMAAIDANTGLGKRAKQYHMAVDRMKARAERVKKAQANQGKQPAGPKSKPAGPIVSKPVAIVSDVSVLHKDAKEIDAQLKLAIQKETEMQKKLGLHGIEVSAFTAKMKELESKDKDAATAMKKASEDRARLTRKSQAMKDVISNHEAMEARKNKVSDLEKKAAQLQKEAEELRKQADKIKKGR